MTVIMVLLAMGAISAFAFYFFQQRKSSGSILSSISIPKKKTDSDNVFTDDADEVLGLKSAEKEQKPAQSALRQTVTATQPPVVLYLMAPEKCVFAGYELLQALLSAGLRYGHQQIFHRHTHKDGRGEVLFHCASAEKPGSFDLSKMGSFTTSGLSLFFSPDRMSDPLDTFDVMLDTIDQLVEDLSGVVLDENRQLLTKEKMVKMRQWIRSIAESKNTADMFAEVN